MSYGDWQDVSLRRGDSSHAWGFRLEGGVDTESPLRILRVTPGSLASQSGLRDGDLIRRLNHTDCSAMTHEAAKMEIIRSGNDLTMTVSRGPAPTPNYHEPSQTAATVWKPAVRPVDSGHMQQPKNTSYHDDVEQVTQTSLHATNNWAQPIGTSHNLIPKPFSAAMNSQEGLVAQTTDGRTKRIVHSQFNSPSGLYSKSNAMQTFNETYRQVDVDPSSNLSNQGYSSVSAPTPRASNQPTATTGSSMYCGACGEMIKGVFVKVQNTIPMHPSCLKCVKCGVGLRNIGYFYIEGQLYCETHARQVSRPPEPGMQAMAVFK